MIDTDKKKCSKHQLESIIGFCLNKSCKQGRLSCLICLREIHSEHFREIFSYNEVKTRIENNQKSLQSVLHQINELESVIKVIKISYQTFIQSTPLEQDNTQFFQDQIDALLRTDESQLKVWSNAFEATMKQIRNYAESIFNFKINGFEIKENIEKLNQIKQLIKQDGCSKSIQLFENILISQNEFTQYINYQEQNIKLLIVQSLITTIFKSLEDQSEKQVELIQNYQFSANLTNSNISVTLKKAEQVNNTSNYALTLIQPSLPKSGSFTIKIKIIQLVHWICLGLCKKEIVSKNQYSFANYSSIGHGCYLISTGKSHYSNDDSTKNQSSANFSFSTNDIIQLTANLDKACVTWNNETIKQQYNMSITLDQELCFCAVLHAKGDSIEIIE